MFSYFRLMSELDLNWVMKTEKECYSFPWSEKGVSKVLDDGLAYIFCDLDGQLLGYAFFLSVLDEIHLLNIAVAPNHQKNGIAKKAVKAIKSHFNDAGFNKMFLEVRESNSAVSIYKALDFKVDGLRKGYYPLENSQKEDAILMSCDLNNQK